MMAHVRRRRRKTGRAKTRSDHAAQPIVGKMALMLMPGGTGKTARATMRAAREAAERTPSQERREEGEGRPTAGPQQDGDGEGVVTGQAQEWKKRRERRISTKPSKRASRQPEEGFGERAALRSRRASSRRRRRSSAEGGVFGERRGTGDRG